MKTAADSRQLGLPWLSPVSSCPTPSLGAERKGTTKQIRRGTESLPESVTGDTWMVTSGDSQTTDHSHPVKIVGETRAERQRDAAERRRNLPIDARRWSQRLRVAGPAIPTTTTPAHAGLLSSSFADSDQ